MTAELNNALQNIENLYDLVGRLQEKIYLLELKNKSDNTEKEWIEHNGKSWPDCKPGDLIEVAYENGEIGSTINGADKYIWKWDNHKKAYGYDIVAWRLAK